ncbi:Single-stranded DNA-binding protein B [bioreactor metagenome]|uniref:Single-stranded DNA-binding protein B n=1 Tax=bioreactor metagenome TaxID=1076179 RepID=A0A645FT31_9ZZZZ
MYWKKASEALAPYLKKGKVISVMGRINIRAYTKENGEKKYSAQVVAEQIQFVDLFKHKEKAE